MEKDTEQVFRHLKKDVTDYAELRFELLKLSTYEQVGKLIALLSYGLLLSVLALIAILFAHLVLGFFLSKWFDSLAFGFGIIFIMYVAQAAIVVWNRKYIKRCVMENIIRAFNYQETKEYDEP